MYRIRVSLYEPAALIVIPSTASIRPAGVYGRPIRSFVADGDNRRLCPALVSAGNKDPITRVGG